MWPESRGAPGFLSPGIGRASRARLGLITGPIRRLLQAAPVVDEAPSLHCPALPQPLSLQFLPPLGVGTAFCRVLELSHPPFPDQTGARALDPARGRVGSQAFTLGLRERCGPWICLWNGRGDSGIQGEERGAGVLAPTLCLTLQSRGSGFKAGSLGSGPGQQQGGWGSPGMCQERAKVLSVGVQGRRLHDSMAKSGLEAPGGREMGGKRLFGLRCPAELPLGGLECGVRPRRLPRPPRGLRAGTPYRPPEAHLEDPSFQRCPLQPLAPWSPRRSLGPRLSRTNL